MKRAVLIAGVVSATLAAAASTLAQEWTRGVGVYPGRPAEDWSPRLVPAATSLYRNLALRRAAYQSSSYDYNLTAQLVTDGVVQTAPPRWLAVSTAKDGVLERRERELIVDHNRVSTIALRAQGDWVQLELGGGEGPPSIDTVEITARVATRGGWSTPPPAISAGTTWTCAVQGSDDAKTWTELGRATAPIPVEKADRSIPIWFQRGPEVHGVVPLSSGVGRRFYRIALESTANAPWDLAEVGFRHGESPVEVGGPYHFDSAWKSAGSGQEWVAVDLGAPATFDRVVLHWIRRAASGSIQVSDDNQTWRDVEPLPASDDTLDDLHLAQPVEGRYVRVLMTKPRSPEDGYVLSELEVDGHGGLVPEPKAAAPAQDDGRLDLSGGGWRLQRDSAVQADGAAISRVGFGDDDWVIATVPATVLSSYENVGALPDPDFGDNQLAISDSFFYSDFWYRTELEAPPASSTERVWLNLDGVNWKAELYLNGTMLGRVEGAFMRGRFDVTDVIHSGANALAVRIVKNATPGSAKQKTLQTAGLNGGALGADNPTYHASIGWDWIPTVRGRDIGLWNDVYLTRTGPVVIQDPVVRSTLPLPDTSSADLSVEVTLRNATGLAVEGTLRGRFGDVAFSQPVSLAPQETRNVVLDPTTHPTLHIQSPKLWWPVGYGKPNLYDVGLAFDVGGTVSDATWFKSGVRQFTYGEDAGALKIWINGRRFIGRGGNWGFPESNLRYRGREYDAAVRYHADMHFTMIRNWVGQTGDDELYEACDRHGIVVWQDFWLANPADGPDPDDDELFLSNVRDTLLRLRRHASVGLYCGRNEGNPPEALDLGIRAAIAELAPEIHYISNSAAGGVSGGGPYAAQSAKFYFLQRATTKLHSELGMPNVVTLDSLRQMMPGAAVWPPALDWGLHDFNLQSAQRLTSFQRIVDQSYGGADNAKDWLTLAQFVDYDGYRAIFEAQGRNRMGVLLWMSHPAWPSFVWQTYDYYLEANGGYFGSKKGSEPLHIQWNPASDAVEVVNYSAGDQQGLTARAEILQLDGTLAWSKEAAVDLDEDAIVQPVKLELPEDLTPVFFVRLKLLRGTAVVSENFYWRGTKDRDYTALRTLPAIVLDAHTTVERLENTYALTTELHNATSTPAIMVHVKPVRETSGDRILPALMDDNYVAVMPGETRRIHTEVALEDTRGEPPRIVVEGFNVR